MAGDNIGAARQVAETQPRQQRPAGALDDARVAPEGQLGQSAQGKIGRRQGVIARLQRFVADADAVTDDQHLADQGVRAHFHAQPLLHPAAETGLLAQLAQGALLGGLARLLEAAGQAPLAQRRLHGAPHEQQLMALVEHHDRRRRHRVLVVHDPARRAVIPVAALLSAFSPACPRTAGNTFSP